MPKTATSFLQESKFFPEISGSTKGYPSDSLFRCWSSNFFGNTTLGVPVSMEDDDRPTQSEAVLSNCNSEDVANLGKVKYLNLKSSRIRESFSHAGFLDVQVHSEHQQTRKDTRNYTQARNLLSVLMIIVTKGNLT